MSVRTMLVALLAGLAACGDGRPEAEPATDDSRVATTYAPELGVDLDRMQRTPSGLYFEDVVEGTGAVAETGSTVVVHYTGWLPDGSQFDSSRDGDQPFQTPIGEGRVIQGWDQGIPGMRVGGQRRLVIPYDLAYGEGGRGSIPPRATLVFDVELLEVR